MKQANLDRLRELFVCTEEGHLIRRSSTRNAFAGSRAGTQHPSGYRYVHVDKVGYGEHQVVWAMTTGRWQAGQIDHINGVKNDNRIANLRDVPAGINQQNILAARANSKTGVLGVCLKKGNRTNPWAAQINVGGRSRLLGYYPTQEEAHTAYVAAKREQHPGCTL